MELATLCRGDSNTVRAYGSLVTSWVKSPITWGGTYYRVAPHLFILNIIKQKNGTESHSPLNSLGADLFFCSDIALTFALDHLALAGLINDEVEECPDEVA